MNMASGVSSPDPESIHKGGQEIKVLDVPSRYASAVERRDASVKDVAQADVYVADLDRSACTST
jgi:hypothetical protein